MFDGKSYDQIDALAMELPLGSVIANLFMGKSGYNHFNSVQSYYAVDTWVMLLFFNSESDVDQF